MRNFIQITLLFLVITHLSFSQELIIKDLKLDPLDLSARSNEKKDVNGEVCALLIVNTNLTDLFFDGEIVEVIQQETGGYWVYLPPRVKKIKVIHKDFLPNELILPIVPKSYDVFNVTIFANKYNVQNNLNRLTFILNEANVYISSNGLAPIFTPGNNAVFDLPNGKHTFVFSKNGFKPETITVDLKEAQTIKVNLVQGDNTINFPLNSFVIVNSEPTGADVLLNGQKVGVTPYQGKNTAGEYVLSLNYPLFYSHELSFKVKEGDSYTVPTVKLKPNFGYLQIKTIPTDAELIIDGKNVQNNYPEKLKIKSGYHSIVVKKSMYEEEKISLNLKDEELKPLEVDLKPNYTSLSIKSEPQGAKVFIDNNYVGTTPYVNDKIGFGNYSITLQKDLYMDYREDILIGSDAKIEKNIVLTKNYGTLNITAKDADIYIDGLKVASNNYSIKLKSGTYKIKASKEYHTDHEVEVFLTNGQTENLILNPAPKMGALSIVTNPFEAKNATIYINNQKQTQTTPAIIPIIIGEHKVVVEKKGYISQQKSVVIKQSEEKELVFNLQSFNGSLEQKIKNQTLGKNIFKISTLLLAATGGYFLYANENLYTEYTNATTNATEIFDKIQQNNQIATVSFASVLPSVIMWKIKSNQIKKNKAKLK